MFHSSYSEHSASSVTSQTASTRRQAHAGDVAMPPPPASNTGVQVAKGLSGLIVDWLSFTLPCGGADSPNNQTAVLDLVTDDFGPITELDRGWLGYGSSGTCLGGLVRVGWDSQRLDMGVHVSMGAKGLAVAGELNRALLGDVRGFARYVYDLGGHFTRLDFAIDDRGGAGVLDLDEVYAASVRGGGLVTRFRAVSEVRSLRDSGRTFYYGSRASGSMVRIYDKAAEQGAGGHWVRVELEVKGEKAKAMGREWAYMATDQGAVIYVLGILGGLLDFRVPNADDSTQTRWPRRGWWAMLLQGAARRSLSLARALPSVDRAAAWLDRQVAVSLAWVYRWVSNPDEWLRDLIVGGSDRLGGFRLVLLEQHNAMAV
jgi:hypothetical protein